MYRREWEKIARAIEVLRLFTTPRKKPYELREIDAILGYTPGQASRLLKHARKLGLLTFRDSLPMPRDRALGVQLTRKYPGCKFIVVETHHPVLMRRGGGRSVDAEDDLLHERLGRVAAQYLSEKLKSIERIGVGAGRALFHTARELFHYPQAREYGGRISVISLHGHVDRRLWRDATLHPREATDAVRVTDALTTALRGSAQLAVHEPLIQRSLREARLCLRELAPFIDDAEWRRKPPDIALVGMGVMGGLPAMQDLPARERRMQARRRKMMAPIGKEYRELRRICAAFFEEHGYIPVSDVCDRLFWVPEPVETTPKLYMRATQLLRRINEHILGVLTGLPQEPRMGTPTKLLPAFAKLDRVAKVVVVAGGDLKIRGLAKLLDHRRDRAVGRHFMDLLITDQKTARHLLEFRKPVIRKAG